jgi:hypothetical protein
VISDNLLLKEVIDDMQLCWHGVRDPEYFVGELALKPWGNGSKDGLVVSWCPVTQSLNALFLMAVPCFRAFSDRVPDEKGGQAFRRYATMDMDWDHIKGSQANCHMVDHEVGRAEVINEAITGLLRSIGVVGGAESAWEGE